jgi:hypothetical protein
MVASRFFQYPLDLTILSLHGYGVVVAVAVATIQAKAEMVLPGN